MYLTLPTNMAYEMISATRLKVPLSRQQPANDPDVEAAVIASIYELVQKANGDVAVIVDGSTLRHGIREELEEFLDKTQFPVYAAPMGKSVIDEDNHRYGGVSCGSLTYHLW